MSDEILRLERVTKAYGRTVALDALDLAASPGEFVTLLGPSGCGKTTTLRILGGFERPDEGRVLLDGADVTRDPPERRGVNTVFQDYALFPHMSVGRNVAFGLEQQGVARDAAFRRVAELLAFLDLEGYQDRTPDQLSGGQRQRVALARALAPDPKVLLLDEPLGALDAKLRAQVQVELKHIQRRTGKTFVFVTHDQDEALTMSDRIVVMNAGRIEQSGTPEDLYHRPRSRFVAGFVGETNLLECTVLGAQADLAVLEWRGARLQAATNGRSLVTGDKVGAALRPEAVACTVQEPANAANALPGVLAERLFKGNRTLAEVRVGTRNEARVNAGAEARGAGGEASAGVAGESLRVVLDRGLSVPEGAEVWLSWEPQDLAVLA